jgi:hypothetical protein
MRLLQIQALTDEDVECLMRELALYSPARARRSVSIELEERSQSDLLAVLSALEQCLLANDIRTVRLELDGRPYTMAPPV